MYRGRREAEEKSNSVVEAQQELEEARKKLRGPYTQTFDHCFAEYLSLYNSIKWRPTDPYLIVATQVFKTTNDSPYRVLARLYYLELYFSLHPKQKHALQDFVTTGEYKHFLEEHHSKPYEHILDAVLAFSLKSSSDQSSMPLSSLGKAVAQSRFPLSFRDNLTAEQRMDILAHFHYVVSRAISQRNPLTIVDFKPIFSLINKHLLMMSSLPESDPLVQIVGSYFKKPLLGHRFLQAMKDFESLLYCKSTQPRDYSDRVNRYRILNEPQILYNHWGRDNGLNISDAITDIKDFLNAPDDNTSYRSPRSLLPLLKVLKEIDYIAKMLRFSKQYLAAIQFLKNINVFEVGVHPHIKAQFDEIVVSVGGDEDRTNQAIEKVCIKFKEAVCLLRVHFYESVMAKFSLDKFKVYDPSHHWVDPFKKFGGREEYEKAVHEIWQLLEKMRSPQYGDIKLNLDDTQVESMRSVQEDYITPLMTMFELVQPKWLSEFSGLLGSALKSNVPDDYEKVMDCLGRVYRRVALLTHADKSSNTVHNDFFIIVTAMKERVEKELFSKVVKNNPSSYNTLKIIHESVQKSLRQADPGSSQVEEKESVMVSERGETKGEYPEEKAVEESQTISFCVQSFGKDISQFEANVLLLLRQAEDKNFLPMFPSAAAIRQLELLEEIYKEVTSKKPKLQGLLAYQDEEKQSPDNCESVLVDNYTAGWNAVEQSCLASLKERYVRIVKEFLALKPFQGEIAHLTNVVKTSELLAARRSLSKLANLFTPTEPRTLTTVRRILQESKGGEESKPSSCCIS